MNVNTLVKHKKLSTLGIGCVSKVLKTKVRVNFGLTDTMMCSPKDLIVVDTSKCKTITIQQYRGRVLSARFKANVAIFGNEVRHFVGIGWITVGVVKERDLETIPRVVSKKTKS